MSEKYGMRSYPHMCRDGHDEVGWRGDDEDCPVCRAVAVLKTENARLSEELDRLHAAIGQLSTRPRRSTVTR